jgi:hypothetical protein
MYWNLSHLFSVNAHLCVLSLKGAEMLWWFGLIVFLIHPLKCEALYSFLSFVSRMRWSAWMRNLFLYSLHTWQGKDLASCECPRTYLWIFITLGPELGRGYPLNLSISISGGKETKMDSPSNGEWNGKSPALKRRKAWCKVWVFDLWICLAVLSFLERNAIEGDSPLKVVMDSCRLDAFESGCLRMQPKVGGKLHPRLNMCTSLIANKYREGKLKSTLKREWKVRETIKRKTGETTWSANAALCSVMGLDNMVDCQSMLRS